MADGRDLQQLLLSGIHYEEAAEQIFAQTTRVERDNFAKTYLVEEAWRRRRHLDRAVERRARGALRILLEPRDAINRTGDPDKDAQASMHEFLRRRDALWDVEFAIDDGAKVTWADATIAEHEQRISSQAKKSSALADDIALHQWAVGAISAAGVRCLAEVPSTALVGASA